MTIPRGCFFSTLKRINVQLTEELKEAKEEIERLQLQVKELQFALDISFLDE